MKNRDSKTFLYNKFYIRFKMKNQEIKNLEGGISKENDIQLLPEFQKKKKRYFQIDCMKALAIFTVIGIHGTKTIVYLRFSVLNL